ncbi:MAG: FkbM family methyltransferase [Actinobacteria bacterium]|nr:FkbM family methyltransferase [Actinomycetota bacterium]
MSAISKVSGLLPDKVFVAAIARAHRRFEPELGRIVAAYPGGGTVLDVGAWYGPWTRWLAPKADRVIALEPNPDVAAVLERCVPANVVVRRAAASDHSGTAVLTLPEGGRGTEGRASLEGLDDSTRTVIVETVRLDDLDVDDVGMLKVDVEGHERVALAGGRALIEAHHPLLVVEIEERHGGIAPTVDLLAELGYSGKVLVDDRWSALSDFDLAAYQEEHLAATQGGSYLKIAARRGSRYVNNVVFTHPETPWDVR